MANDSGDAIADFLDMEPMEEMVPWEPTQLAVVDHKDDVDENAKDDYKTVRENLLHAVSIGTEAVNGLAKVAHESESPRAYEVLGTYLKTLTEMNKSLLEVHQSMKNINGQKGSSDNEIPEGDGDTYVFVGTTEDMQKMQEQNQPIEGVKE